ncbi:amidohydrolase [Candidatus Enterococcus willemsii]|uniref:Amidohydrolase n=1 Tax=Candidatus Enterococcus willemsii TaxID=1857215 RepID=A0ABQ6Z010_9ENTE|nr:amidohydrolase [Enterococcus sp. CU12B]KAF1304268.1 amidohydrolase [Enterococcus sp. CU12B]
MRQLIKNVHLLTMDEQYTEIPNAYVLIEDETIQQIGRMVEPLPQADTVIDGNEGILLPGMINTHTHVGMIPFRSLGDDVPDRLRRFLFPLEQVMTKELARASAQYATAEMLLSGVTSFCDMYYFEDDIAEAVAEMESRAILGETIIEMATCDFTTPEQALDWCDETFIQKWQHHPLITPAIAPHATNTNSPELLARIIDLGKKHQVPITMHVAEMTYEMTEFAEKYQQTPIAFLNDLGYFDHHFIMAHCIFTEESDLALLDDKQVSVAHCIGANTKSAKGVAPVKAMLTHHWDVGLGTDGPSSGNTLDLFTQMRMFANFHKTYEHDRGIFPAKEIVALATIGGAKVLGLDTLVGSIEVGKKADVTLIETQSLNMFPIFDAYSALVYSANAGNVSDVWVNGKHLVANKKLVKHDSQKLKTNLMKQMDTFIDEAQKRAATIK